MIHWLKVHSFQGKLWWINLVVWGAIAWILWRAFR